MDRVEGSSKEALHLRSILQNFITAQALQSVASRWRLEPALSLAPHRSLPDGRKGLPSCTSFSRHAPGPSYLWPSLLWQTNATQRRRFCPGGPEEVQARPLFL